MKFDTKLDERDFDTNITLIGKQEEKKDEERFSNLFKYFNTTEICLRGILYFDGVNTVFCEQIICLLKKEKKYTIGKMWGDKNVPNEKQF